MHHTLTGSHLGTSLTRRLSLHQQYLSPNGRARVGEVGLSATPFIDGPCQIYTNVVSAVTTHELVGMGRLARLRDRFAAAQRFHC